MNKKKSNKIELIIGIIIISIFVFETIGFAHYNKELGSNIDLTLKADGTAKITNVVLNEAIGAEEKSSPIFDSNSVQLFFDYNVTTLTETYAIKYDITITNDSAYDYIFSQNDFNASLNIDDGSSVEVIVEGINLGDKIQKKSEVTFSVLFKLTPKKKNTTYSTSVDSDVEVESEGNYSLLVAIPPSARTADMTNDNDMAHFVIEAINGFDYSKNFTLFVNSSNFILCDSLGNPLDSFTIDGGESKNYDFYVKRLPNAEFVREVENLTVMYTYDESQGIAGTLNLSVDVSVVSDTDAPIISNVNATQNSTANSVHVTWSGSDSVSIDHYTIQVFDSLGNKIGSDYTTVQDETFIDVTVANNTSNHDGAYYFKVYGMDALSNTATTAEINNATTSSGHCSRSSNINFKWYAKVSYTGDITTGSVNELLIGSNLQTSLSKNLLETVSINSIKMNGTNLTTSQYSTTSGTTTYTIRVNNVTGDIVIDTKKGNSCLVEGTKVLLANGKYKNIEDITYYDLLAVWNYDEGKITYEYPIWIEKPKTTNRYQLNIFSDGTTLKTVGFHGIYNYDLNRFVSVDNKEEFYIGATVAKINNGKIEKVKVENIEIVNEEVNYYHVVSSRYYNIISNDILTTDGTVAISNLYGFDENIKWKNKNINENELYDYSDFSDIVPYYMYYAMRMNESAYLKDYGMNLNTFKYYLTQNQLNTNMYKEMLKFNDVPIFKVSTSDGINKFILENDKFIIPGKNNMYINTLDNKVYKSNDVMNVTYSSHLVKIK